MWRGGGGGRGRKGKRLLDTNVLTGTSYILHIHNLQLKDLTKNKAVLQSHLLFSYLHSTYLHLS